MPKRLRRQRVRLFMAFEGKSEVAFVAWLQALCDERDLHVHLDRPRCMTGGDPLALVQDALRLRRRSEDQAGVGHRGSCLLIDADRLEDGSPRSSDAIELARMEELILIRQRPCFEGTLLRLHAGHEHTFPAIPSEAERLLRRVWETYNKPPTKAQIAARFGFADLRRAAESDPELRTSELDRIVIEALARQAPLSRDASVTPRSRFSLRGLDADAGEERVRLRAGLAALRLRPRRRLPCRARRRSAGAGSSTAPRRCYVSRIWFSTATASSSHAVIERST